MLTAEQQQAQRKFHETMFHKDYVTLYRDDNGRILSVGNILPGHLKVFCMTFIKELEETE